MGLIALADLQRICRRAIDEHLAENRDVLFFGISASVTSLVRRERARPADGLKLEADQLNQFDERSGDGYFLGIWLTNCAEAVAAKPAASKFFRDWAEKVDQIVQQAPAQVSDAKATVQAARREAANDQQVEVAQSQLRNYIGALSRRATNLMISKRLHDGLHQIQVSVLPLWRRGIENFASAADLWRPIVADRQRNLRAEIQEMAGEYSTLPAEDPLRKMAEETVKSLTDASDQADAALAAGDPGALTQSLFAVRDAVKDDMRAYANRIEANQEALDLGILVQNLVQLGEASSGQQLKDSTQKSASALAAIMQDLDLIGPQHRLWQDLDVQLWQLEEFFGFLSMGQGAFAAFDYQWRKVVLAIDELAKQPPADWTERITKLRDDFLALCPVPVKGLPSAPAAGAFDDFVLEVRRVFQTVDQHMKDTCNLLREITFELAKI